MQRREFITLLAGAALIGPPTAIAQTPKVYRLGTLTAGPPMSPASGDAAVLIGALTQRGYTLGQNLTYEARGAAGKLSQMPQQMQELKTANVDVVVTVSYPAALIAKSSGIPTVIATGSGDPVAAGLVASLNRPGGNVTGVSWFSAELGPKRLALLHDLLPNAMTVAVLRNPNNAEQAGQPAELQEAARTLGLQLLVLNVTTPHEIDTAFATVVQERIGALIVAGDSFLWNQREQIMALAAQHAVPAIYGDREMAGAGAGGLMSYGNSSVDAYRRAGIYTARILKGEKPADLPVDQATRFELVINLKTARTLGLQIPDKLLALADEVIE